MLKLRNSFKAKIKFRGLPENKIKKSKDEIEGMIYKILYDCGKKQDGILRAILTIGLNRSLTVFSPIVLAESQIREGSSLKRFGICLSA